jgi:hypothetical protein
MPARWPRAFGNTGSRRYRLSKANRAGASPAACTRGANSVRFGRTAMSTGPRTIAFDPSGLSQAGPPARRKALLCELCDTLERDLSPLRLTGFLIAPHGLKICLFDQLLTFRSFYTEFLLRCSPTPSSTRIRHSRPAARSRTLATKRVSVVTPGSRIFCSTSLMVVSRTTRSPH